MGGEGQIDDAIVCNHSPQLFGFTRGFVYKVEPTNQPTNKRNAICIFVFSDPIQGAFSTIVGGGGVRLA